MRFLAFVAIGALLVTATKSTQSSPSISVTIVAGRCVGCQHDYSLGRFAFVSANEGWSTAFAVHTDGGHVSQWSGVVHTRDSGRTWRSLRDVETYGVDGEPALSFFSTKLGWIGWFTPSDPMEHLQRTVDGGSRWTRLPTTGERHWVFLDFLDQASGYGVISTPGGPRFGRTRNGGVTWSVDDKTLPEIAYPDEMQFLNADVGWIAGSSKSGNAIAPALLRTVDGGTTWHEALFPVGLRGNARDLFFVDEQHGWMVVWNTPDTAFVRTTDGGKTWTEQLTWKAAAPASSVYAVRFLSPTTGLLIAGPDITSDDSGQRGHPAALITRDAGASWSRQDLPAPVASCETVAGEVWCGSGMGLLKIRMQP